MGVYYISCYTPEKRMIKIFTIPFLEDSEVFYEDTINQYLLNKKVNSIKAEFFKCREKFYWTIFVDSDTVVHGKKREEADKPAIKLDEQDELLLKRLKEWRKERAAKEGIPVYIIANNAQLLQIIELKPVSKETLKKVKGYGKKKIEQYGDDILKIVSGFLND
jgi:superfamily II DNA helicase RecQ